MLFKLFGSRKESAKDTKEEVKISMADKKYVAAIDQGTTSTRCMLFTKDGKPAGSYQMEHEQIFPHPGWVEHNAMEIWSRTQDVIRGALAAVNAKPEEIAAVGITNQRETTVVWEKATGKPIYNAIVWQCTRTQDFCAEWLKKPGWSQNEKGEGKVKDITGLLINHIFQVQKSAGYSTTFPAHVKRLRRANYFSATLTLG